MSARPVLMRRESYVLRDGVMRALVIAMLLAFLVGVYLGAAVDQLVRFLK